MPRFVRQLPSVKANVVPSGFSIIMSNMSYFPFSCWLLVRYFDEPSLLQYCGAQADILILLAYVRAGLIRESMGRDIHVLSVACPCHVVQ